MGWFVRCEEVSEVDVGSRRNACSLFSRMLSVVELGFFSHSRKSFRESDVRSESLRLPHRRHPASCRIATNIDKKRNSKRSAPHRLTSLSVLPPALASVFLLPCRSLASRLQPQPVLRAKLDPLFIGLPNRGPSRRGEESDVATASIKERRVGADLAVPLGAARKLIRSSLDAKAFLFVAGKAADRRIQGAPTGADTSERAGGGVTGARGMGIEAGDC